MPKVIIYSTTMCPYCVRAKNLLISKGIEFEEIRVDIKHEKMLEMINRSHCRTVPQIFIDDFHVGGFDDMAELDMTGRLNSLLGINNND